MPIDGTEGCLRAFTQLKQQYPQLKVILSIGGGGKGSENFASVARNPSALARFAQSARELVDQFGLDGIDSEMLWFYKTLSKWKKEMNANFDMQLIGSTPRTASKVKTTSTFCHK